MELVSERLVLRSTREEDSDFCLSIWLDDAMGKYLSDPPRDKASDDYHNFAKGIEDDTSWMPFIIMKKDTNESVGTCSLIPNHETHIWDLGYCIHENYQRQGYATEAIKTLIDYCRKNECVKLTAEVAKENTASNAVLTKLNFMIETETSFKKSQTELIYPSFIYCLILK